MLYILGLEGLGCSSHGLLSAAGRFNGYLLDKASRIKRMAAGVCLDAGLNGIRQGATTRSPASFLCELYKASCMTGRIGE